MGDLTEAEILELFKGAPEDCNYYDYYDYCGDGSHNKCTSDYTRVTNGNYYWWSFGTEWKKLSPEEVADLNLIKRPVPVTQETKEMKYLTSAQEAQEAQDIKDNIKKPSHYQILDGCESIEIMASAMSMEAFYGYCLGNIIKYRLRAGNKGDLAQDIGKANFYKELYDIHKHLCRDSIVNAK